jgi:hypothetical protein
MVPDTWIRELRAKFVQFDQTSGNVVYTHGAPGVEDLGNKGRFWLASAFNRSATAAEHFSCLWARIWQSQGVRCDIKHRFCTRRGITFTFWSWLSLRMLDCIAATAMPEPCSATKIRRSSSRTHAAIVKEILVALEFALGHDVPDSAERRTQSRAVFNSNEPGCTKLWVVHCRAVNESADGLLGQKCVLPQPAGPTTISKFWGVG